MATVGATGMSAYNDEETVACERPTDHVVPGAILEHGKQLAHELGSGALGLLVAVLAECGSGGGVGEGSGRRDGGMDR